MFELNAPFYSIVAVTFIVGCVFVYHVICLRWPKERHIEDRRTLGPGPLDLEREARRNEHND